MMFYKVPIRDYENLEALYSYIFVEFDETDEDEDPGETIDYFADYLYSVMGEVDLDKLGFQPERFTLEQAFSAGYPIFTQATLKREERNFRLRNGIPLEELEDMPE